MSVVIVCYLINVCVLGGVYMFNWEDDFDEIILERGRGYFITNYVKDCVFDELNHTISAVSKGSELYQVQITLDAQNSSPVNYSCTCPYATKNCNCKHMVAVMYQFEAQYHQEQVKESIGNNFLEPYGFESNLVPFLDAHPDIELEIVSGGLFTQNNRIGDFPHMAVANEQIHQMYSVEFGTAYNNLITDGSLVLNSLDAAIGFGLLRDQLPQTQWIHVAQDLQNAFYQQGRSLSDVTLYEEVATKYGLDGGQIKTAFIEAQKTTTMHPDFKRAMELGAQSFPTFVLEKDGQYYDMRSQGDTVEAMENCLSRVTG